MLMKAMIGTYNVFVNFLITMKKMMENDYKMSMF